MNGPPKEVHPRFLAIVLEVLGDLDIDHEKQAEFADERPLTTSILTNALAKLKRTTSREDDIAPAVVRFVRRTGSAAHAPETIAIGSRFDPG